MDTEKEVQNGLIIKSILEISLDKYFRLRKDSINVKAKMRLQTGSIYPCRIQQHLKKEAATRGVL